MPGEKWKDIAGYEGYYQVSNKGRVKSLDRFIPHPRLYQQFVKGRILKQKVAKDFNKITGDAMISMQVALSLETNMHYYNVRRLVYNAFNQRIDYDKDGLYVINKDGDGFNNSITNLRLVTKSYKQHRSIARGRQDFEYLRVIDRSKWKKNYSRRMAVNQYSPEGKLIKKYQSIKEAHLLTGFDSKGISKAAKGLYKGFWCGYKWAFENKKHELNRQKHCSQRLAINQYNAKDQLVRRYDSIAEAHLATGFDPKGISQAAKGLHNGLWRGYKWAFENARLTTRALQKTKSVSRLIPTNE
ncbi:MAG: NUMOD4 domain-containing protein [Agriterribacter sp.]